MPRHFCLRFDIDTPACIDEGIAPLADLGRELGVPFTFFAHMGRAIDRSELVRGRRSREALDVTMLPAVRRIGVRGLASAILVNPNLGRNRAKVLRALADAGHEVGLHGGRNHQSWFASAPDWDRGRLLDEVRWGVEGLRNAGLEPFGFASPGAVGAPALADVLAAQGFRYLSDRLDQDAPAVERDASGILLVPVTILGSPGGVGYLEWATAMGFSTPELEDDFRARLASAPEPAIAYDHPCWAGRRDVGRVRRLVEIALEEGYDVTTMRAALPVT